jgi:hypothetical protein
MERDMRTLDHSHFSKTGFIHGMLSMQSISIVKSFLSEIKYASDLFQQKAQHT